MNTQLLKPPAHNILEVQHKTSITPVMRDNAAVKEDVIEERGSKHREKDGMQDEKEAIRDEKNVIKDEKEATQNEKEVTRDEKEANGTGKQTVTERQEDEKEAKQNDKEAQQEETEIWGVTGTGSEKTMEPQNGIYKTEEGALKSDSENAAIAKEVTETILKEKAEHSKHGDCK